MPADNLVPFEPRRRRRREPAGRRREPVVERLACVLFGSMIAALGLGLALLGLSGGGIAFHIVALLPAALFGMIGVFGISWVVQGLRGRSRHEGPFYLLLGWLERLGPRIWSLAIPVVVSASLLAAALTDDRRALAADMAALIAWTVFLTHVGLHELGHFLAARILRLPVTRVLVGPAELGWSDGRWRLELSRDWRSVLGGLVSLGIPAAALPPRSLLLFALGGPVATALLVAVLLLSSPYPLATLLGSAARGLRFEVFSLGTQIGLGVLALNLWPSRGMLYGGPSDGYQILAAWRQGRRSRRGA